MLPTLATAVSLVSSQLEGLEGVVMLLAEADRAVNPLMLMAPYALIAVLAYFILIAPKKNQQQRFQKMLDDLKENDHVVTTGGIHGVVTNVQRDQQRVTLRIDESTGAKLRVSFWAIDSVVDHSKNDSTDNK